MLGVFTDQAHNLILLAEDEARMLGQPAVEPEHLLLASARRGNVESLLRKQGVTASDIHAAIVRGSGLGSELVLGRVPRSKASDAALERAVDAAAARGILGPSSEHVLLGLLDDDRAAAVLRDTGIVDGATLVDATYPRARGPLSPDQVKGYLLRVGTNRSPPRPGPNPPVFERFTAEAQHAIRAAVESAALLENHQVEPFHLLLGCLHVPDCLASRVLVSELSPSDMGTLGEAMERARMYGPNPAHQATGIFTDPTRQIVAEEALKQAYRHDHHQIGTGHLLLATLDSHDTTAARIVGTGVMGSGPVSDRIAREVVRALPGDEHTLTQVDHQLIQIDQLTRSLAADFAQIVPEGWTVRSAGRIGAISLNTPDSQSEEDFRIDLSWIIARDGPAQRRLLDVTQAALENLQQAITSHTSRAWPSASTLGPDQLPAAHSEIDGEENMRLRMWFGTPTAPVLELSTKRSLPTHMILSSF